MLKNDYRRALIMLRPLEGSWSGHIRLERRTLMGSMQFTLSGPGSGERMLALMAGLRGGSVHIHLLGELRNGGRGQAGARFEFDPRNMSGLALEQYDLAAVARLDGEVWRLVMSGFPNGSRCVDWGRMHDAVAAIFAARPQAETSPAQAMPEEISVPDAPPSPEDDAQTQLLENPTYPEWSDPDGTDTPAGAAAQEEGAFGPAQPPEIKTIPKNSVSRTDDGATVDWPDTFDVPAEPDSRSLLDHPTYPEWSDPDGTDTPAGAVSEEEDGFHIPKVPDPEEDEPPGPWDALDLPAREEDPFDIPAQDTADADISGGSALDLLAADAGAWPESIEPLITLFSTSDPWPDPPETGFVFVQAPMPTGCAAEYTLVGLRAENGRLAEVAYAIPAPFSAEPPPGLEEYVWRGGYWIYRHELGCV